MGARMVGRKKRESTLPLPRAEAETLPAETLALLDALYHLLHAGKKNSCILLLL